MNRDERDLSPIRIRLPFNGILYPTDLRFSFGKDDFDYLEAYFPTDVAQNLEQFEEEHPWSPRMLADVEVNENGSWETVQRMHFRSELLKYGVSDRKYEEGGRIELHDMHELLQSGLVDMEPDRADAEKVYGRIFSAFPDDESEWLRQNFYNGIEVRANPSVNDLEKKNFWTFATNNPFDEKDTLPLVVNFAIDIDQATPLEAINQANKKFNLRTHFDTDGTFVVGGYLSENEWTASNVTGRADLHIKNGRVASSTGMIDKLVIEGPKYYPNVESIDPLFGQNSIKSLDRGANEALDWANNFTQDDDKSGYRLQVVVDNQNIKAGEGMVRKLTAYNTDPARLRDIGTRMFQRLEKNAGGGELTIEASSSQQSPNIKIGDRLRVESIGTCGDLIDPSYDTGLYLVSHVEHVWDGEWKVHIDLKDVPVEQSNLKKKQRILDLSDGRAFTREEKFGYQHKRLTRAPEYDEGFLPDGIESGEEDE